MKALAGGRTLSYPAADVCERTARQFDREESAEITQLGWEAALRLLGPVA